MFAALLQKLGIADEINKKAALGKGGHDVAVLVAEGRAEIGTTFISEVLPVKGVRIVGTLPGELHNANTYTAAIHARATSPEGGMALLRKLTNATTRPRWTAAGLELALQASNIELVRCPVGDKYVMEEMIKRALTIGGEHLRCTPCELLAALFFVR